MGLYLKIIQDKAHYKNILILGYGDLAKQLANILKSNYDITICNRNNKDLDEIKQIYHHLDLNALSGKYDLIINTIPVCKINYKKLKYKNGSFITTKKDSSMHGFGIISIKRIVSKYNGNVSFSSNLEEFVVNISIPLPQNLN